MSMERRDAIEGRLGPAKVPTAQVIVCPVGDVPSSEPEVRPARELDLEFRDRTVDPVTVARYA